MEAHVETDVRFVRSVGAHGFGVGDAGNAVDLDAADLLEQVFEQPFEGVEDVFLFHEGHFAVHLGEFRLAVGPEVFIAEAAYDLVVLVHPGHHQQLFEGLGRLGQGVKFAGIHPGRYHEIAGPFGRGFDQIGGFDVHEALLGEVFAHGHRYPGAQ